jgi:hypothetical protein
MFRSVAEVFFDWPFFSLLPLGEELGMRVYERDSIFLFVLRAWRVAFKDKNYQSGEHGVKPSPQPSPKRERELKQQRQIEDCRT